MDEAFRLIEEEKIIDSDELDARVRRILEKKKKIQSWEKVIPHALYYGEE